MLIARQRSYFTGSFRTEKDMLLMMVKEELNLLTWASHFTDEEQRDACCEEVMNGGVLQNRIKQTLSDRIGGSKRNARDKLLQSLGYSYLLSTRSKPSNEMEERKKEKQRQEFHDKFAVKQGNGYDFSIWRRGDTRELAFSEYNVGEESVEEIRNDLFFAGMIGTQIQIY